MWNCFFVCTLKFYHNFYTIFIKLNLFILDVLRKLHNYIKLYVYKWVKFMISKNYLSFLNIKY